MRITDFAEIAGVTTETIRKYRDRLLIRPDRNDQNGYYDYSRQDFMNLMFIRKMRGAGVSLDTIENMINYGDVDTICERLDKEQCELENELRIIENNLNQLKIVKNHYDFYKEHKDDIAVNNVSEEKIDAYFRDEIDPDIYKWILNIGYFTQVLHISKDVFELEELPDTVPIELGIGTYRPILDESGLAVPKNAQRFPPGMYVTCFVTTDNVNSISGCQLKPMMDYIRSNGLKPVSDTTGFLFRIKHEADGPKCIFLIRIRVQADEP